VTAIHVDHGLRAGSADDAEVVRATAERFGARFEARTVEVALGPNVEARARAARYAALPPDVLTGHTADDQAETILLNLVRGAGLDGLRGMPRARRPLIQLRRSETHALCDQVGLTPVTDPMNASHALRRNRVRHELLPLLDAIACRDVAAVISRQGDLLTDDAALLDARAWLRAGSDDEHHPPDAATVERVLAVARGDAVATDVGGGRRVTRSRGRLTIVNP